MPLLRPRSPDWKAPPRGIGGCWFVLGLLALSLVALGCVWLINRPVSKTTATIALPLPVVRVQDAAVDPASAPMPPPQTGWSYRHQTSANTQALIASASLYGQGGVDGLPPQVGAVFTTADRRAQVLLQNIDGISSCEAPVGCRLVVRAGTVRHEWTAVANQGLLVFPDTAQNLAFLLLLSSPAPDGILMMDVAVLGGWQTTHFSATALEKEKLGMADGDLQPDVSLLLVEEESDPDRVVDVDALAQARQEVAKVFDLEMGKRLQAKSSNGCLPSPGYPARAQVQVDENGLPRKYEKQWSTQEGTARKVVYYDAQGNTRQSVLMLREAGSSLFKLHARTYLDASGASVSGGLEMEVGGVSMDELAEDPWATMESITQCAALARSQQGQQGLPASQDFVPASPEHPGFSSPEENTDVFIPAQPEPSPSQVPPRPWR